MAKVSDFNMWKSPEGVEADRVPVGLYSYTTVAAGQGDPFVSLSDAASYETGVHKEGSARGALFRPIAKWIDKHTAEGVDSNGRQTRFLFVDGSRFGAIYKSARQVRAELKKLGMQPRASIPWGLIAIIVGGAYFLSMRKGN